MLTQLSTHVESDATSGGKFAGNLKIHDSIVHDATQRCQYVKKLAQQWQLYSHASDIQIGEAVEWLADLNLADGFYMTDLTKDHFSKTGSKTEKANMVTTISDQREIAFDLMSAGQMKFCQSDNEYRTHKSGITETDIKTLANKTQNMVTWQFYLVVRQVQFTANSVWKDVAGENIDFKISIPNWTDLPDVKKKELKEMEAIITEAVGPSFKVIESQLRDKKAKKLFVQQYRNILDTYVYLHQVLNLTDKTDIYNKISLNIINMKADGNLLMNLLEEQKFVSGDELKQLGVVHSVTNQMGNLLESAFIWTDLFKRDHDDSVSFKKAIDDYSFCSLVNYRNRFVKYIMKINTTFTTTIQDKAKDTAPTFDSEFFKKVITVYPMYVIDALNKTPTDEDPDLLLKKGLLKSFNFFEIQAQMLIGPFTNVFVTHAYNKADVVKEFSAVYNRYRNVFTWKMKHGSKSIKNKMFFCKGCGGVWGIEEIARDTKFFNQVALAPSDKTQFMVSHRIVSSSSMKITYKRLYNYKFETEVAGDQLIVSDVRVPTKDNASLFSKISAFLANKKQEVIKQTNIQKDMFILKKTFAEFLEAGKNLAATLGEGVKVTVFKETGKADLCLQDLINDANIVITDKHAYSYVTVSKKSLDSSGYKGCSEVSLVKAPELNEFGTHYPVFVSRVQEWKKFDVMWTFRSKLVSEGVEDYGNQYGVSQMTFQDQKGLDAAAFDAVKFEEQLTKANTKRDLTPQGLAIQNPACVYKNNKAYSMASYLKFNLAAATPNLKNPEFNNASEEDGVKCTDLDKHLKFDNIADFNASITEVTKISKSLASFASCGSYRRTVKIHSKRPFVFLVNKGGKIKEQQFDTKSFELNNDQQFHARITPTFRFTDQLKIKLMPAHWMKIKPIKLGDKNSFLFITVLTSISAKANFLGLSSSQAPLVNLKPTFNFPGFNKSVDQVNTNLTTALYSKGMTLATFMKRVDQFVRNNAKSTTKHREFVKVLQEHSVTHGCDKMMKGISISIDKDQKIVETCGTNSMIMSNTYQIEVLYVSAKEAKKLGDKKFLPPSADEISVAGMNGQVFQDAGKKQDVLDVGAGIMKYRIWARPNLTLPYELEKKSA